LSATLDHVVVMAASLEQGLEWAQETLGVKPQIAAEVTRFGTKSAWIKMATPTFPLAYLEIIALNPLVTHLPKGVESRWFDMDDKALRESVKPEPRLIHWVANVIDLHAAHSLFRMQQIERGQAIACTNNTAKGVQNWTLTVRPDGQRLFDGCAPSLVQWGKPNAAEPMKLHPRNVLPRSGLSLKGFEVTHPSAPKINAALTAIQMKDVVCTEGPPNLQLQLNTPKGPVVLSMNP